MRKNGQGQRGETALPSSGTCWQVIRYSPGWRGDGIDYPIDESRFPNGANTLHTIFLLWQVFSDVERKINSAPFFFYIRHGRSVQAREVSRARRGMKNEGGDREPSRVPH